MNSDTALDYALFQLSPRRSHCELFIAGDGKTEKLASGLLKPFTTHLKVAEEQVAQAVQSIKLEVERRRNASTWFNKGTLERFVRFVSTPEVLELVNTLDAEMSQLEGARRIYSQGVEEQHGASGESVRATTNTADITKKELLKAIDVRLLALKQDLTMACSRASSAGFTLDNVSELLLFADRFDAYRLNEACTKFISLCQRRPDLLSHHDRHHPPPPQQQSQQQQPWKGNASHGLDDRDVRSSSGSDMSLDDSADDTNNKNKNSSSSSLFNPKAISEQRQSSSAPTSLRFVEREREVEAQKDKKDEENTELPTLTQPASGVRRLSVQDRINLFENKQKEQSGGANTAAVSAGSGKKIGGKAELRRLSSDVSTSAEKSVLRRWSGASDMSIDLNSSTSNRKETESAATTPSSFNSQAQAGGRNEDKDTASSLPRSGSKEDLLAASSSSSSSSLLQPQFRSFSRDNDQIGDVGLKDQTTSLGPQLKSFPDKDQFGSTKQIRAEGVGPRGQAAFQNQFRASPGLTEDTELKDQASSQTHSRAVSGTKEHTESKDQVASSAEEKVALKEQEASHAKQVGVLPSKPNRFGSGEVDSAVTSHKGLKNQPASFTQFRTSLSKGEDNESNRKALLNSQAQSKVLSGKAEATEERGDSAPQSFWKTFPGKSEETSKGESTSPQVQSSDFRSKVQQEEYSGATVSGRPEMKLNRQTSAPDHFRKMKNRRDERTSQANVLQVFPGRKAKESAEAFDLASTPSNEPVNIAKPSKGNQELNNELLMKADELEKLFAAHKLRVPGDQAASTRRGKPADLLADNLPRAVEKEPAEVLPERSLAKECLGNGMDYNANMLMKMVDNQDFSYSSKQKLGDLSSSEDSRGKFYEIYMQKRDAKLREEGGTKRAQKEAKMKAMQDSLEHSRAEMKAKFAGSADRQDSALLAHRRAEKMRTYSARAVMKNKEQQPVGFLQNEEEDAQDFSDQIDCGQDKFLPGTPLSDSSSKSSHSKKLLSSKTTPRTSTVPIPKPSSRPSNSAPGRHRMQPENALAQSVPNFSDLRKENTKPLSGISKTTTHTQSRDYTRSKSINEEVTLVNEDKPWKSQSMRKSSAGPVELNDHPPTNSDSVTLMPLAFSQEQMEHNQVWKKVESKPFLRKGNGIGPGVGAGIAKQKASMASENLSEEQPEELAAEVKNPSNLVNEEEDGFETVSAEEASMVDNENSRLSDGSAQSVDRESDSGEVSASFSNVQDDAPEALAAATTSKFNSSLAAMQESPGESPMSWNSRVGHSFSYAQEAFDLDASVDSPLGSPPSWNSHPLNQMMESDAARMRKKWGSAQKPILVAHTSHQSRKDVTKGFKRLLKFGRKSKGPDNLITDWVSASTNSEGDDDTEDGRDLASRASDDTRKSRMGFPQYHSAYDGFNDDVIFHEQAQSLRSSIPAPPADFRLREDHLSGSSLKAPRSFFSLSTFRSKGSESKLR